VETKKRWEWVKVGWAFCICCRLKYIRTAATPQANSSKVLHPMMQQAERLDLTSQLQMLPPVLAAPQAIPVALKKLLSAQVFCESTIAISALMTACGIYRVLVTGGGFCIPRLSDIAILLPINCPLSGCSSRLPPSICLVPHRPFEGQLLLLQST